MPAHSARSPVLFSRGSWAETNRIAKILREETLGGALLLVAAVLAIALANSPWSDSYESVRDYALGPESLHLHLTLGQWAGDGLLAIFFFVAGLELKRQFLAGDLRELGRAVVPVAAAVGGVIVPALLYVAINANGGALRGWAIPTATDIAFALAALAVIGTHLPVAMRTFLLTLAVVDDLIAIAIIAVFYTSDLSLWPLLGAVVPLACFAVLVRRGVRSWVLLLPVAFLTWALVHASGIHATVAGVLLAFTVPVLRDRGDLPEAARDMAQQFEHMWRPVSAGVAVPVFAFFSAGVHVGGRTGLSDALSSQVAIGVMVALIAGKTVGVLGATALTARFTRARLDPSLAWVDVLGLAVLCGIGFTVSLLIGELSFGEGTAAGQQVKVAVVAGSLGATAVAAVILRLRNRTYRRIWEKEQGLGIQN